MSKKQLEEIESKINWLELRPSQIVIISRLIDYAKEQAELVSHFSKKNGELNVFLNEYSEAKHWGQNVIDVAMDVITEQAERVDKLKDDKVELYKLNAKFGVKAWDIEQQNNQYREWLERVFKADDLEDIWNIEDEYLDMEGDSGDLLRVIDYTKKPDERVEGLQTKNKKLKEQKRKFMDRATHQRKEKQRYREAINGIKDELNMMSEWSERTINIVRLVDETLEGELDE